MLDTVILPRCSGAPCRDGLRRYDPRACNPRACTAPISEHCRGLIGWIETQPEQPLPGKHICARCERELPEAEFVAVRGDRLVTECLQCRKGRSRRERSYGRGKRQEKGAR